jgi:Fungal specific transcription factor domain/Fungal Zn(2)-Cys(6) binuclear cluster domain
MSNIPGTGQFRAKGQAYQHGSRIRRYRPKLSCAPCLTRKVKCDRGRPCETCVKRSDESSCTYDGLPGASKESSNNGSVDVQARLSHIEQLVRQVMRNTEPMIAPTTESLEMAHLHLDDASFDPGTEGNLHQNMSETGYTGSTHWSTILDNIEELKTATHVTSDVDHSNGVEMPEEESLFGISRQYSMQQILSDNLPSKVEVDRRLSAIFNAKSLNMPCIHIHQFQRQYAKFWEDPLAAPPLWVSMMFSLCCMAAKISEATDTAQASTFEVQEDARAGFLRAATHCLVLGGFSRPQHQAVEALVLYAQCKYMSSLDPSRELCLIISVVSRIAYMMGYHRDPDNFSHLTVFEGEMRRRTWSICRKFDLMVSFQFGLPSNIPIDSWDTKSPRNLLDSDFDEETKSLPPSRPQSEPSPILYFVVKHALMNGFTKVCNHALSFATRSPAEVLELDNEIRQMYLTVPESLRMRPMALSLADPPYLIIMRLHIEFLHQKCMCILHRRYMARGDEYSTKACVDAANTILTYFIDVNKEFEPGGQLYANRWALSSFNVNDFLLAVMSLCLFLCIWKRQNPGKYATEEPAIYAHLELLKQSYKVCVEMSTISRESKRVVTALKTTLQQFEPQSSYPAGPSVSHSAPDISMSNIEAPSRIYGINSLSLNEEQFASPSSNTGELNLFENMFTDFENIDWIDLAQYFPSPDGHHLNGGCDSVGTQ